MVILLKMKRRCTVPKGLCRAQIQVRAVTYTRACATGILVRHRVGNLRYRVASSTVAVK